MTLPEGVTLQWERLSEITRDLRPLLKRHWTEVEDHKDLLPLDPAWGLMLQYDLLTLLRVLTVRSDGVLVGYLFLFFPPSLHYSTSVISYVERFWLEPSLRKGWLGIQLFKEAETLAREAKAVLMLVPFRTSFLNRRGKGIGAILKRLGYKTEEITYAKVL